MSFTHSLSAPVTRLTTSRAAGLALAAIGAEALPEIESALGEKEAPRQRLSTLAKVLGRIGGTQFPKYFIVPHL